MQPTSRNVHHSNSGGEAYESKRRIVAFSSGVVKSFPGHGSYYASKGGVEALVRVLANELHGRNINIKAVAAGSTGTGLFLKGKSQSLIHELAKMAPIERLGTPADIAKQFHFSPVLIVAG